MQVFTPTDVAKHSANKYLSVLIAAKFARVLNEFPRDRSLHEKKLTTRALELVRQIEGLLYLHARAAVTLFDELLFRARMGEQGSGRESLFLAARASNTPRVGGRSALAAPGHRAPPG